MNDRKKVLEVALEFLAYAIVAGIALAPVWISLGTAWQRAITAIPGAAE